MPNRPEPIEVLRTRLTERLGITRPIVQAPLAFAAAGNGSVGCGFITWALTERPAFSRSAAAQVMRCLQIACLTAILPPRRVNRSAPCASIRCPSAEVPEKARSVTARSS